VLGVNRMTDVMEVLRTFQDRLDLTAFEFFSHEAMGHVVASGAVSPPFATQAPFYALLEIETVSEETVDTAMELFERCTASGWVVDGVMSQNATQAKNLWRLREDISESISKHTPYKNDISVTVSRVPAFLEEIDRIVAARYPHFEIIWFGHIGDGNVHLNILKPAGLPKAEFFAQCLVVNQWVFEAVERHQGSVSAEHGIGLMKKKYLGYSRSPEEIACLKAIKTVFDPANVMNPGKLFDLP